MKNTRTRMQWLVQHGLDSASEASDVVARRLAAFADPRNRLLRKRRWALRLGLFFAVATAGWIAVTTLLATWNTPAWALAISGSIAAAAAFPATLLLLRYNWLRREPLPAPRPGAARRMPPPRSAAREAMSALEVAERGLFAMLGVLERSEVLPASQVRELADVARQCAAAMAATAAEVVTLERAAAGPARAREQLTPTITAFAAQLEHGLAQYNAMVDAAAALVSSINAGVGAASPMQQRRHRHQLDEATDRMYGWAQAYDELRSVRRA